MASEDGDLSDFDIHLIMEALSSRQSKVVASCALSIKILLTEIQQQLLDLMVEGSLAGDASSNSENEENYLSTKDAKSDPVSSAKFSIANLEDMDEDPGVTQEAVVTGATVPITGSRIRSPNPYPCLVCQEVFSTKKALSRHAVKHDKVGEDGDNSTQDMVIDDAAATQDNTNASDQSHSSTDAENSSRQPIKLKLILPKPLSRSGQAGLRLTCEECGTQTLKQHMARHMLTHSGIKPFVCNICETAFSRKDKLKEHMKKHEEGHPVTSNAGKTTKNVKSKVNKCKKCDFATEDKQLFKEHRKTHPTKMVYKCEECDKEFHCPSHLEQHNIKHRNEKPYMCDMCGVSFSREPNLARHIRSHTNPAPFHCKFCNKPYHRNNELIVHERTHTGEKPYICEICGNGYASTKYLKRHLFTHTGLKPFKCDLCARAFARPENMRAHRKLHDKISNRLPLPTTDAVASAFRASQMDTVMDDNVENMNSSHAAVTGDMYEFPNTSTIRSSASATDPGAMGDNSGSHLIDAFKLSGDL